VFWTLNNDDDEEDRLSHGIQCCLRVVTGLGFFFKKNPWLDQDVMDVSLKLNGKRCHSIIPLL